MWAIRRKGLADASEASTMAAGKAAGLVDVKVAQILGDAHRGEVRQAVATRDRHDDNHDGAKARWREDRLERLDALRCGKFLAALTPSAISHFNTV